MNTNEWFPVSSVSEKVSIPPETVRRYARRYGDYLRLKRGEKNAYLIHKSSFERIREIRQLLDEGHQHIQVKKMLKKAANGEQIAGTGGGPADLSEGTAEMVKGMQMLAEQNKRLIHLLDHMHERMNRYEEFLHVMQKMGGEQDGMQRDHERKRDEFLTQTKNELRENRKEKEGLFIKLFKR